MNNTDCLKEAMAYDMKESGNKKENTLWYKICQMYPSRCPFCGSEKAKVTNENLSCGDCKKVIISYIQPETIGVEHVGRARIQIVEASVL